MCRRNGFTSTTTNLVLLPRFSPPVPPSLTCFIVLARLGFWNTRVIRGRVTCQESKLLRTASHGLGPGGFLRVWITVQKADVVSSWKHGQQGFACAGTGGRCSATVQKQVHPKASASRSENGSSRASSPSSPVHHERTTMPENTSFE